MARCTLISQSGSTDAVARHVSFAQIRPTCFSLRKWQRNIHITWSVYRRNLNIWHREARKHKQVWGLRVGKIRDETVKACTLCSSHPL